jgi:hypothetical protein
MHTNEDIWEIRRIAVGKGMRVAKEATMGMIATRGPATTAAMELVATTAVTMGLVTSQAMMMIRAATTTGLVITVTTTGPVATTGLVDTTELVDMTELVTTRIRIFLQVRMGWNMRMSDIWGRLGGMERPILPMTIVTISPGELILSNG